MALTGAVVGSVLNRSLHLDLSRAFVYALALLCIGSFREKKSFSGLSNPLCASDFDSPQPHAAMKELIRQMNFDSQVLKSLFPWHHLWRRGERNMAEKERECERDRGSQ